MNVNIMINALMIVAHPDDETIWAGGLLSRNNAWNWTIASLCRASDSDRMPKFEKTCRGYGADCFMADLEDTALEKIETRKVQELLLPLSKKKFDLIFTHGKNGEYGHIRHKDTHNAVVEAVKSGILKCKKLFVFAYKNKKGFKIVPNGSATKKIGLSRQEIKRKKEIVEKIYGYTKKSPDVQYCSATESFREVVLE